MLKKGLAVAVILLFIGLALTPTTYGDFDKPDIEVIEEDVTPTPIALVFQLIAKLRNHKDIENIESEDDVLQIIEGDEELNNIFEQLSGNDCDCEEDVSRLDGSFPIIRVLLVPFAMFSLGVYLALDFTIFIDIFYGIGGIFNCWWY